MSPDSSKILWILLFLWHIYLTDIYGLGKTGEPLSLQQFGEVTEKYLSQACFCVFGSRWLFFGCVGKICSHFWPIVFLFRRVPRLKVGISAACGGRWGVRQLIFFNCVICGYPSGHRFLNASSKTFRKYSLFMFPLSLGVLLCCLLSCYQVNMKRFQPAVFVTGLSYHTVIASSLWASLWTSSPVGEHANPHVGPFWRVYFACLHSFS